MTRSAEGFARDHADDELRSLELVRGDDHRARRRRHQAAQARDERADDRGGRVRRLVRLRRDDRSLLRLRPRRLLPSPARAVRRGYGVRHVVDLREDLRERGRQLVGAGVRDRRLRDPRQRPRRRLRGRDGARVRLLDRPLRRADRALRRRRRHARRRVRPERVVRLLAAAARGLGARRRRSPTPARSSTATAAAAEPSRGSRLRRCSRPCSGCAAGSAWSRCAAARSNPRTRRE